MATVFCGDPCHPSHTTLQSIFLLVGTMCLPCRYLLCSVCTQTFLSVCCGCGCVCNPLRDWASPSLPLTVSRNSHDHRSRSSHHDGARPRTAGAILGCSTPQADVTGRRGRMAGQRDDDKPLRTNRLGRAVALDERPDALETEPGLAAVCDHLLGHRQELVPRLMSRQCLFQMLSVYGSTGSFSGVVV